MSINRVYHPYDIWEETYSNMWGSVKDKDSYFNVAVEFTGNHELYGQNMRRVIKEWPVSCEHNLTNITQNRKAWIGHAACALAFGCPEDIVRKAWSFLSEDQQAKANNQADMAIEEWERNYSEGLCLK